MIFTYPQTLVLSTLDIIQYYLFINRIFNGRHVFKRTDSIWLAVAAFSITQISIIAGGTYSYFINSGILMAMAYALYRPKGLKLIYLHLIAVMCVITLQMAIIGVAGHLLSDGLLNYRIGLVAQLTGAFGAFIVTWKLPVNLLYAYVESHNKAFKIILINLAILLTLCIVTWYLKVEFFVENLVFISLITAVVILINTVLLRSGLKNQVMEEQNKVYERYLPIVNGLMDEVRAKQHDFDNHIAALQMMIHTESDRDKALSGLESYIRELYSDYEERVMIRLENKLLSGFLYSKKKEADEKGILFNVIVRNPSFKTGLKDFEIMEVLGILIDNAFETGVQDNRVIVLFEKEGHMNVVEIVNRHPYVPAETFRKMFTHGYSEKCGTDRGIGLYKLQQLVRERRGDIEVSNRDMEGNHVVIRVLLPVT